MRDNTSYLLTLILLVFAAAGNYAQAQISPGKLSEAHSELEGIANCTKCHELGKDVSDLKCLECHKSIAARINSGKGYHSSPDVKKQSCAKCHSEHHGLEFELIYFKNGSENFNHDLTGYILQGKHTEPDCRNCHRSEFNRAILKTDDETVDEHTTFLGLIGDQCLSCHADEHRNQLSDKCLDCHDYSGWKPAPGFDHNKTAYRLTGRHRTIDCAKCHPIRKIEDTEKSDIRILDSNPREMTVFSGLSFSNCNNCHRDVHAGKFGDDCSKCHTTDGFRINGGKIDVFNHDLTDFPLRGRHRSVNCNKCHTGSSLTEELRHERCDDCHSDRHNGQFRSRPDKGACESCHTLDDFAESTYDIEEHNSSAFPLKGSHLAIPCLECHKESGKDNSGTYRKYRFDDLSCSSCHPDIHNGEADTWLKPGGCACCHSEKSWRNVSFDHSLSSFPLTGKHVEISCGKCHRRFNSAKVEKIVLKPLDSYCSGCHEDIHLNQFTDPDSQRTICSNCHQTASWQQLLFDHNSDSRFKLDGAHGKVECYRCHKVETDDEGRRFTRYKPLAFDCSDCHGGNIPVDK